MQKMFFDEKKGINMIKRRRFCYRRGVTVSGKNVQRKAKTKHLYVDHVDNDWIRDKIGGCGGSWGCNGPYSLAFISHIYNKNFLLIFWYNMILYFRYLKRRIRRTV